MSKIKVYIDWNYDIKPSDHHSWINSPTQYADLMVSINKYEPSKPPYMKALWLLEPESIEPELYSRTRETKLPYDYIVSHRDDLITVNDHIQIHPCTPSWINGEDRQIYSKTKNISMIASTKIMCNGHSYRQNIADRVKTYVDLYGKGRERELESKMDGLKDYRFSIAMENGIYNTYYTEKILDCFLTGTIPIYWGTENIYKIFNPDGIIRLEEFINNYESFDYEKEYEIRKEAVNKNFEIAKLVNFNHPDGIQKIVDHIFRK